MRLLTLCAVALLLLAAACGSENAGNQNPTTGTLAGEIDVIGPFNGAPELNVGAFAPGSTTPVQTAVVGRISSVATATLTGRTIDFSFTELPFGSYEVGVYSTGPAGTTFIFRSAPVVLSDSDATVDDFDAQASFTGNGPFGSISGVAVLEEGFAFTPNELAFIGFSPVGQPQSITQFLVDEDDVTGGQLFFNVDGIAYGNWNVGFYSYDPATRTFDTFGLLDDPLTVGAGNPNVTGAVFPAASTGDPGADPELGTISGTVSFNGTLPAGQSIFIGANTVPPQQGAPPATIEVNPADIGQDGQLDYTLPLLPSGDYAVAIFSYDFSTHQAVYFGQANGTVSVTDGAPHVTNADFNADVSVIGGTISN